MTVGARLLWCGDRREEHVMSRVILASAVLGLLAAWPATGQVPLGYEIVTVTDNPYYEPVPRINNRGQIVFMGWMDNSNRLTEEIFLYDNGRVIRLTNDNIQDVGPDINDDGTIVWSRGLGPIHPSTGEPSLEIVMWRNGKISRLTDNAEYDGPPQINNSGHVVWSGDHPVSACGGPLKDIFMYDGRDVVRITTDGIPDQVENQSPEINDSGQIVWTRYDFCNPPAGYNFDSKIMLYDAGTITELTTGQLAPQLPDINNAGKVVWFFFNPATRRRTIELWDAGVTSLITGDGELPAINDHGQIAFSRWDPLRQTLDIWSYRQGRVSQINANAFFEEQPDINDAGEMVWSSGGFPHASIRYLRRSVKNVAVPRTPSMQRLRK
jgi:hypothetical protein